MTTYSGRFLGAMTGSEPYGTGNKGAELVSAAWSLVSISKLIERHRALWHDVSLPRWLPAARPVPGWMASTQVGCADPAFVNFGSRAVRSPEACR